MTNKEKTKIVIYSSVQHKSFRTENVVQTDGEEICAFALPCLLGRSPIAYCAKCERQFWFTPLDSHTLGLSDREFVLNWSTTVTLFMLKVRFWLNESVFIWTDWNFNKMKKTQDDSDLNAEGGVLLGYERLCLNVSTQEVTDNFGVQNFGSKVEFSN